MKFNYVIVGAGFSGSVLAERLANVLGVRVLVVDKRDHLGGNSYDYYDREGLLVHKYGPHYFRTDHEEVIEYLSGFTGWLPCRYRIKVSVKGRLYTFPVNRTLLNDFFKVNLKSDDETRAFLDSKRVKIDNPVNSKEKVLSACGAEIYETFFKPYTIKQWGQDPEQIDASVAGRIPVRVGVDDSYFDESFQAMPEDGYAALFEKMLNSPKIEIMLKTDYKDIKDSLAFDKLIYTGPLDDFFDYRYGRLPYRSLYLEHEIIRSEFYQPVVQINYPQEHEFTRVVEIKHVTRQKHDFTNITREYPLSSGEPFYPIPCKKNQDLYEEYRKDVDKLKNVFFIGRLAEYKYLNMDQVVYNALGLFDRLKNDYF